MSIAQEIISCQMPDFDRYLRQGESLDDIDEYGFTPLIESAITRQVPIAEALLQRKASVNKTDVTGRTPLHWAADNDDLPMVELLLRHGADPNAYTNGGLSVLVYPLLRGQNDIKQVLYQYGAKLDFAQDFINTKLLGHRYELTGDVDILNAQGEFIELDYEGFMLEFTVAVLGDSLRRFTSSYATRHLRAFFPVIYPIIDAFSVASELLKFQRIPHLQNDHMQHIQTLMQSPLLILPAASRGHALCFLRYGSWWAKIDRGENSLKEGSVNIYRMTQPDRLNRQFLQHFLYKKQPRSFFHQKINQILGLQAVAQLPMSSQISGNCSWANMQAALPVAMALQVLEKQGGSHIPPQEILDVYAAWLEWDKDRALDEAIQRFYLADPIRKASFAAVLGTILFQACDHDNRQDLIRAEKILKILTLPEYDYILRSYLDIYCVKRLTRRGNNLLKILDDCGIDPKINVNFIATGLHQRR